MNFQWKKRFLMSAMVLIFFSRKELIYGARAMLVIQFAGKKRPEWQNLDQEKSLSESLYLFEDYLALQ